MARSWCGRVSANVTVSESLAQRVARHSTGYTRHVVRRIFVMFVLLALGSGFGVTLALGATGVHRERIHVLPTAGSARTVFVLSFTMPERTGLYGSSQRHDMLTASAPAGSSGCVKTLDLKIPDARASAHVRVTVDPRKLDAQWCQGTYRGQIEELQSAVCPRGALCPTYVLVRGTVGRFSLHVHSTPPLVGTPPPAITPPPLGSTPPPGADGTPPSFAGLQSAFACTPGPQTPEQTTPFTLSWKAATDDLTPSSQIVYDVYLATTPGGEDFSKPTWTTPQGAASFTTPGLASHGTFYFMVRARDLAGNEDSNTLEQVKAAAIRP
jgi:hypothetical protein